MTLESPLLHPAAPANYRKGAAMTWHQRRRHRAVLGLLRRLSGSVLDYGCGYGDLTFAMSRTHAVVGVDADSGRIDFARQEYPSVAFQVCPAEGLSFEDGSFDNVASVVVIHFVPDHLRYLREIHRVLRDGGHLLIACKNRGLVRAWFRRLFGKAEPSSRLWLPRQADMEELLRAEGFEILERSSFYDPPVAGWKNAGDWLYGSVEQLLCLLRIRAACGYYLFVARKMSGVAPEKT